MAHQKQHIFLRSITNDKRVVCINLLTIGSFEILSKHKIKVKGPKPSDPDEFREADTIAFYYPSGTGLKYSVGVDITQDEFNYMCTTLLEFLYLNEAELKSKTEAIKKAQFETWNKISEENSSKVGLSEVTPIPTNE